MIFEFLRGKNSRHTEKKNAEKQQTPASSFSRFFKKYKWYVLSIALVVLLLFGVFKQIGFILLLTAAAVLSRLYERFLRLEWGIELVTLSVVLITLAYSPFLGALMGIIALTVSVIVNHPMEDPKYLPISWIGLLASAYIVNFFSSFSLLTVGIIGSITYNLVVAPIFLMMGARFYKVGIFSFTNILFNYFIFTTIAPTVLRLIT